MWNSREQLGESLIPLMNLDPRACDGQPKGRAAFGRLSSFAAAALMGTATLGFAGVDLRSID